MLVFFTFWACTQSNVTTETPQTQPNIPSQGSTQNTSKQDVPSPAQDQSADKSAPVFAGSANAATSGIPNLLKGISKVGCDNGPGGAGAVSYFYDELSIKNGVVTGTERWIMYANTQWKARNGNDCEVQWSLKGKTRSPTRCPSCTMGITVTNDLDKGLSNCPEDMAKTNSGETINYDIQLNNDGTAVAYFSRSGKKFAEGYHKDGNVQLLSPMSCRWF